MTSDESLSTPKMSTGTIPVENVIRDFTSPEPANLAQKKVCEILKCLYANVNILFITRGFKGLIMSGYSQFVRTGGVLSFQAFTDANRLAMQVKSDKINYGEEMDFTFIASEYEEAFGKEKMIILPFELLRDDQKKFLSIIETQLGLSRFEAQISRINESLSPVELYWYPRLSSVVSRIARRFSPQVYAKIYGWYVGKTLKNRFRIVVKIFNWLKPNRGVTEADFHPEMLDYFRENFAGPFGARFRNDPIYKPYLTDILLTQK